MRSIADKPRFITFTGADDHTNISAMATLSSQYPIEWGILFSPKRQGTGRYPTLDFVRDLMAAKLRYAAHLCGAAAREVVQSHSSRYDESLSEHFERVQVNTADRCVDTAGMRDWAQRIGVRPILQCRGEFPEDQNAEWLFDASGGTGLVPASWPSARPGAEILGYAGGLDPVNVADAVAIFGATAENYWIDMETSLRDEDDRFDLARCRRVCEAVYGRPLLGRAK